LKDFESSDLAVPIGIISAKPTQTIATKCLILAFMIIVLTVSVFFSIELHEPGIILTGGNNSQLFLSAVDHSCLWEANRSSDTPPGGCHLGADYEGECARGYTNFGENATYFECRSKRARRANYLE
jgi:hypothetical protein